MNWIKTLNSKGLSKHFHANDFVLGISHTTLTMDTVLPQLQNHSMVQVLHQQLEPVFHLFQQLSCHLVVQGAGGGAGGCACACCICACWGSESLFCNSHCQGASKLKLRCGKALFSSGSEEFHNNSTPPSSKQESIRWTQFFWDDSIHLYNFHLSLSIPIYLFLYLFLSVCLSVCLLIYLHLSFYLSFYLSSNLSI